MRNLKRVLSLGLATVMLLGMMVLGTSAADKTFADLTDSDQIVNKEAVSVLVDLGIVEGTDTGAYQPTLTVNRATMAKFVYCLLNGVDDKGALFADMDLGFSDIDTPSASWAKGYINYCASMGIISGDGNGHFYPDVEVSTVQAAKMLLVALGYNADASKYQNDANWAVNVMRDAQKSGIVARSMSANAGLSRDNTALLVFNTLSAKTVTPEYAFTVNGDRYVSKYSNNDTTLGYESYGLIKVTAAVNGIRSNDGTADLGTLTIEGANSVTGISSASVKIPATADMVGSNVTFYAKGTMTSANGVVTAKLDKVYSSALMPSATTVLYTGMDGTPLVGANSLTNRASSNKYFVAELDEATTDNPNPVTYYLNGQSSNQSDVNTAVDLAGVIVELIDSDGSGKVDVVRATKKTVATVSAEPSFRTQNDEEQVRIPGVVSAWTSVDKVEGYDDLEKDDVVLAYNDGVKIYIEKADSIEAVADGYNTSRGLQVGVEYYQKSGLVADGLDGWDNNFKDTFIFYLDNAQNIVKAVKADGSTTTESTYAVVRQVAWFPGSGFSPNGHMEAKLLFTDGTMKTATITSVDGIVPVSGGLQISDLNSTVTHAGEASTPTVAGAAAQEKTSPSESAVGSQTVPDGKFIVAGKGQDSKVTNRWYGATTTNLGDLVTVNQFYEYTEKDGNYTLKNVTGASLSANPITQNAAKFDGTNLGNSNTVFLFDKGVDKTPDIYTGIAEVPSTVAAPTNTSGNAIVKDTSGFAKFVFVMGVTAAAEDSTDVVYLADTSYTTTSAGKVYDAFINGEPGTITLATDANPTVGLYRVKNVSDKGVSTLWNGTNENTPYTAVTGIKNNSGSTIILSTNDAYVYDADTEVQVISGSGEDATITQIGASDIEVDANDQIFVFADNQKTDFAVTIYVVKVDATAPTVKLETGSSNGATITTTTDGTGFANNKGTAKINTQTPTNKIKVTATAGGNYTVSSITVAGTNIETSAVGAYTSGTDLTLTKAGTLTFTVNVTDDFSKTVETYTYTVEVVDETPAPTPGTPG